MGVGLRLSRSRGLVSILTAGTRVGTVPSQACADPYRHPGLQGTQACKGGGRTELGSPHRLRVFSLG